MNTRNQLWLGVLGTLLIYSEALFGQGYGVAVLGDASACHVSNFSDSEKVHAQGSAKASCKQAGTATSQASADISLFFGGAKATGSTKRAGASALTVAGDTITLIPPQGKNPKNVKVMFVASYLSIINGAVPGRTAGTEYCLIIPELLKLCLSKKKNGTTHTTIKWPVTIQSSDFTFELESGVSVGAHGASAEARSQLGQMVLPEGWTCTRASGKSCPDF